MALRDYYDEADVLDSLSWVGMTQEARVAKLANMYLEAEHSISCRSRNYEGPTKGTVGLFVKSHYKPPRGMGGITIEQVRLALPAQKKIREERRGNPPFKYKHLGNTGRELATRRNRASANIMTIMVKDWNDRQTKKDHNCVGLGRIGDCTVIVESGGRRCKARVYLRHKPTGKVKVVVLEGETLKSITQAMTRMAPKAALRGMFGGSTIALDFEGEGFMVDGRLVPWRNVRRIYSGKKARRTPGDPKKLD